MSSAIQFDPEDPLSQSSFLGTVFFCDAKPFEQERLKREHCNNFKLHGGCPPGSWEAEAPFTLRLGTIGGEAALVHIHCVTILGAKCAFWRPFSAVFDSELMDQFMTRQSLLTPEGHTDAMNFHNFLNQAPALAAKTKAILESHALNQSIRAPLRPNAPLSL